MKTLILICLLALSSYAQAVVSAPIFDAGHGENITVPIDLDDANGIFAFQFHLKYNEKVLRPRGTNYGCSTEGTVADGFAVDCNAVNGEIRVSAYSWREMEGEGTILNIKFKVIGEGCSPLGFDELMIFTVLGPVKSVGEDGMVCVVK